MVRDFTPALYSRLRNSKIRLIEVAEVVSNKMKTTMENNQMVMNPSRAETPKMMLSSSWPR